MIVWVHELTQLSLKDHVRHRIDVILENGPTCLEVEVTN